MPITAFDHYTVRCADLDASWAFYRDALGPRLERRRLPPSATGPAPPAAIWRSTFQATNRAEACQSALTGAATALLKAGITCWAKRSNCSRITACGVPTG
jgi:hypothetical protein